MLRGRNSSSEDQDQNFEGQNFKKIDYDGAFDSDNLQSFNDESLSESQIKKMSKLDKRNLSNKSVQHQDKSKAIKKNRESAKMSRLRKKEYQEKLEQRVSELQYEIVERKTRIKSAIQQIFHKILRSNSDKYKYLNAKIASSKTILQIMKEINTVKQPQSKENELSNLIPLEQQSEVKSQYNPNFFNHEFTENAMEVSKSEGMKGKQRKKKSQDKLQVCKYETEQRLNEKEAQLEMCLKNYIYEFGMKGCLRTDVIQRSKYDWLLTLKQSKLQQTQQICSGVARMKSCLQRLDNKSKLLDFHLRELREKIKVKYAIQFMLDREFFVNNGTQTIYKKTQLNSAEK